MLRLRLNDLKGFVKKEQRQIDQLLLIIHQQLSPREIAATVWNDGWHAPKLLVGRLVGVYLVAPTAARPVSWGIEDKSSVGETEKRMS